MIKMKFDLEPVAKGRPRFSQQGRAYTPDKTRKFESDVAKLAAIAWKPRPPIQGPLYVTVVCYLKGPARTVRRYPTVKPDADNLAKGVLDALNGICWVDDSQIIKLTAEKCYVFTQPNPYIEVTVEEII